MEFNTQKELSKSDKKEIIKLWNHEYPEKLNYPSITEFEKYLENLTGQSHILIKNNNQCIKGWYFDFIRDNDKWFAIILDSTLQGKGFGTRLLNIAKEKETKLNGWVIDKHDVKRKNGELYKSPLNFYLKNGFEILEKERFELENLSAVKIKWEK